MSLPRAVCSRATKPSDWPGVSAKAAGDTLATKNDLNLLESRLETAIERAQKTLVMWFAGIMVVHASAVVALTVGLVKLL